MKPKPNPDFKWQENWATVTSSVPLELIPRFEFLAKVTGLKKSQILRSLLKWWVEKTIGLDAVVSSLEQEWEKLSWHEQRQRREEIRNSIFNLNNLELEGTVAPVEPRGSGEERNTPGQ